MHLYIRCALAVLSACLCTQAERHLAGIETPLWGHYLLTICLYTFLGPLENSFPGQTVYIKTHLEIVRFLIVLSQTLRFLENCIIVSFLLLLLLSLIVVCCRLLSQLTSQYLSEQEIISMKVTHSFNPAYKRSKNARNLFYGIINIARTSSTATLIKSINKKGRKENKSINRKGRKKHL